MTATIAAPSSLRIGQHVAGYGNRCDGRCMARRFDRSQNFDWDVEAVLAVADDRSDRGVRALEALDQILREAAERQEPLDELGPDLLRTLRSRLELQGDGSSTTHSGLTAVLVGGGRFFVIKDSPSPAFLFRGGVLLSLPGRESGGPSASRYALTPPNGGDPVQVTPVLSDLSTWTAGELEDGDALVVCSQAMLECREEADISRALLQSSSPRMAAGRLAEEAHQRGVDGVVVAALFAGMNPASVPPSPVEPPPQALPPVPYQAPAPPIPAAVTTASTAPASEALKTPWIAALAGLAGASIGIAIGVVIAVSLLRPEAPAPSTSTQDRMLLPGPAAESTSSPVSGSYASQPRVNPNPSPAYSGYANNTSPSTPVVRPQTNPIRPGPVNVSGLPPVTQSSTPPRHAVASGMTTKVQVTLYYDHRSGMIIMTSNQGVLYTQDAPLGVPAGEFVAADPGTALRRKADDPDAELHFVAKDEMVARIQGDDFRKLLTGIPIAVPDLAPEDYKLLWFSPNDAAAIPPFTNLRIGGI